MRRYLHIGYVFALLFLTAPRALAAETFPARVVGVVDGDTLRVSPNESVIFHFDREGGTIKVRLFGVDCPEKGQRYGKEARQLAVRLAHIRVVFVESRGRDRYGRIIGRVTLPSGKLLSQELVGAGACWWYKRYAPKDETLRQLEAEARKAKRGLWANPVPPWEWRKGKREQSSEAR